MSVTFCSFWTQSPEILRVQPDYQITSVTYKVLFNIHNTCRHANVEYCFHELNRLYYALKLSIRVMPATGWGPSNENPLTD